MVVRDDPEGEGARLPALLCVPADPPGHPLAKALPSAALANNPQTPPARGADDADGPAGRFLCVALSRDGITNWTKPELDLVPFYDNATGVNHTRTNILNTRRSGTTFIDSNPRAPASQRFKTIIPGGTVYASADGFRWEVLTQGKNLTCHNILLSCVGMRPPSQTPAGLYRPTSTH